MNRISQALPATLFVASACLFAINCRTCCAGTTVLETIAGTGEIENNGDAGPAGSVNIGHPFGVEIGPDGNLYIAEVANHRVRRLNLKTKEVATVAGCGRQGYAGDGGPAVAAELDEPYEIRFDSAGNMYFVEMRNHLIRRVDAKTGVIATVVGSGKPGFGGDGGPATKAQLREPHSIALDGRGNMYIADIGNHRIRRVDLATGAIETIAGNGEKQLPQDGQLARGNALLGPRALAVAGDELWIALREGHSVWRLNLVDGKLRHVAGSGERGYAGDGGPLKKATFNGPKGIAVGPSGDVYVADTENNVVRRIDLQQHQISSLGAAPSPLRGPHSVCVGPDGAIYVGDSLNHLVRRMHSPKAQPAPDPASLFAAAEGKLRAGDYDAALGQLESLIAVEGLEDSAKQRATELAASLLHARGEEHFRSARIDESLADFDREIELQPDRAPGHWQRGIALYYAGKYEAGAKQFELHQTVNPQDVENAAWHFLCIVRAPNGSIEAARKNLIAVTGDPRIPMAAVQQMFSGELPPEKVLQAAKDADDAARFYADLYVGLYCEALDSSEDSLRHAKQAAENPAARDSYMGDVARVHVRLRQQP